MKKREILQLRKGKFIRRGDRRGPERYCDGQCDPLTTIADWAVIFKNFSVRFYCDKHLPPTYREQWMLERLGR